MIPTLFIDADDTLWESEIYYDQAIDAYAALMGAQGFGREEAESTLDTVQRERIPEVGYAPQEFARNLVITYLRLCETHGRPADDAVSGSALEIGQMVIEHPIALLDGVAETLEQLHPRCRLLVFTKGDRAVQKSKLARSGLARYFRGVHIVEEKNAVVLGKLVFDYELRPEQAWMVGNSPRSDINPALEVGIGAIYIPHANTWDFEQEELSDPERVKHLNSFRELADLFPDLD